MNLFVLHSLIKSVSQSYFFYYTHAQQNKKISTICISYWHIFYYLLYFLSVMSSFYSRELTFGYITDFLLLYCLSAHLFVCLYSISFNLSETALLWIVCPCCFTNKKLKLYRKIFVVK